MKKTCNVISVIALILTIIGALNWLAIGIFGFNFVNWITFGLTWLETLLYILVGIAGIYMLVWLCLSNFNMVCDDDCNCNDSYNKYSGHRINGAN